MERREFNPQYYHQFSYILEKTSYRYYDTPDGTDLVPKLLYTTKLGAVTGIICGLIAATHLPPGPRGLAIITKPAQMILPFIVSPAVYTYTTYKLTKLREKDDAKNAMVGGAAMGYVFGMWFFKGPTIFLTTSLSAILCGIKKVGSTYGMKLMPMKVNPVGQSSWEIRNLDWTLTPDVRGNWTTIPRPPRPSPPPPPPPPPPPRPTGKQ